MSDTPQPQPAGTVVIPPWVSSDWGFALRTAGSGYLLLLVAGAVVSLLSVLQQIAGSGLEFVSWGAAALTPVLVVLGWSGGGTGEPVLLTAAVYLFVAFWLVTRRSTAVPALLADRMRTFAVAVKIGGIAAVGLLVAGILVNTLGDDLAAGAFRPWLSVPVDLTSLVFTSAIVGAVAALFALIVSGRTSLARLLGLSVTTPPIVRSGVAGGRRALGIAALSLLALSTLGSLLDTLTQGGITLGTALGVLIGTVNWLLLGWIDESILLVVGASKFLHDGGFVWAPFSAAVAGWMWLSIPLLLAAYLAGGVHAARTATPRSQAEAVKAALLVGPTVAAIGLLVALGWAGQPFLDDVVPIALLLPSLWGLVALVGAWLWANQQGLASGVVVQRAEPTPDATVPQHDHPPLPRREVPTSSPATPEQPPEPTPEATQPLTAPSDPSEHAGPPPVPPNHGEPPGGSDDDLGSLPPPDFGTRRGE